MHFDWTLSLGSILTIGSILLTSFGFWWKLEGVVSKFLTEHEILVRDYCERKGIELHELPTRLDVLGRQ